MTSREQPMDAFNVNESYFSALQAQDPATQAHFVSHFSKLLTNRLQRRIRNADSVREISAETLTRVFSAVYEGQVRHPARFTQFVLAVCNNILREHYKASASFVDVKEFGAIEGPSLEEEMQKFETKSAVAQVLQQLPERDRHLLQALFFEKRDKDEVCKEFGVHRDYLRVLLHRAKKNFVTAWYRRRPELLKQNQGK